VPVIVGGAGVFGLVQGGVLHLERAGYLYAVLAVIATFCAFRFMNNLNTAKSTPKQVLALFGHKHTWVMSLLYIGTFGSFVGFAAAMPLLIKLNFWVPDPAHPLGAGTGIRFAYYAFIGALVGSLARPLGGWLADRFGGARVTLAVFGVMIAGVGGVLWTLSSLAPNPTKDAAIALDNQSLFPWFLAAFVLVFAACGIGNGSTSRMIPLIWRHRHTEGLAETSAEHEAAVVLATRHSSAVIAIAGALGALGGFLINMTFGAPWVDDPITAVRTAFVIFAAYYVFCLVLCWFEYTRKRLFTDRLPSLAHARI
jgi:NNP family nitrate/nitrite transporter-like MFS transporter